MNSHARRSGPSLAASLKAMSAFVFLVLLSAPWARAQVVVFDTIGSIDISELNGLQVGGESPDIQSVAARFTVSSTVYLSSIDLALEYWAGSRTLNVRLFSDVDDAPGTLLASSTVTTVSSDPEIAMANFDGDTLLSTGFNYWLGVLPGSATDHSFLYVVSGDAYVLTSFDGGATWPGGAPGFMDTQLFRVSGTPAIPEPSTYAAIFGACALAVGVWRRRRRAA